MTSFNLQSSCVKIMCFGSKNLCVCWKLNDLKKNPWDAGDDFVHTNLPHGEHSIKDEEERNSANERQDGENRVTVSRSSSL
jgi:hypothetical protein